MADLDRTTLAGLNDDVGDQGATRRFVSAYLEMLDDRLDRAEVACRGQRPSDLWDVVATLRVASAMLGAAALAEWCAHLAALALVGELTAVAAGLTELRARAARARTALESVLAGWAGAAL